MLYSSRMNNRSMPQGQVIPELAYLDVRAAADWLSRTFGFTVRLYIGDHRAQLDYGSGSIVARRGSAPESGGSTHSVMVCVDDVDPVSWGGEAGSDMAANLRD